MFKVFEFPLYTGLSDRMNEPTVGRESWTLNPISASHYACKNVDGVARDILLSQWAIMSTGGDGGQIEPWGPSIRSIIYPNWSDADFSTAILHVKDLIR